MRLEMEKIKDEVRKLGTVLISAGSVALALQGQVSLLDAAYTILVGVFLTVSGAIQFDKEKTS